jgi:hypothetical protein
VIAKKAPEEGRKVSLLITLCIKDTFLDEEDNWYVSTVWNNKQFLQKCEIFYFFL